MGKVVDSTRSAYEVLKDNQGSYRKSLSRHSSKLAKHVKKHHHYVMQGLIVGVVAVFVFASSFRQTGQANTYNSSFGGLVANTTIDEVSSAQVAKQIAQGGNLIISDNITNLADSLEASVEFATTSDSYLAKPQIVSTDAKTRDDIVEYVTKEGDTITSLARQFGVTSDSIRWANDLTGDLVAAGTKLKIPPVSGVIYTVQAGDTAESLAQKFQSNAAQIISFNDAELDGLVVGRTIIIPGGEEKEEVQQQVYFSSGTSSGSGFAFGTTPIYGGNGYSYGYCTWHAANRRNQIGRPLPRNLGNAVTWASISASAGLGVSEIPAAGSVLWHRNTYIAGGYGHVGFVERVNGDGSILVSDMNYPIWGTITTRTISPAEFGSYLFIY